MTTITVLKCTNATIGNKSIQITKLAVARLHNDKKCNTLQINKCLLCVEMRNNVKHNPKFLPAKISASKI